MEDIDRPLAARGIAEAPFMARILKEKGGSIDIWKSSSALRALTTAKFFANTFKIPSEDIQIHDHLYHADPNTLMEEVEHLNEESNSAIFFGHNPGFEDLADLWGEIEKVPTSCIFRISGKGLWKDFWKNIPKIDLILYPKMFINND
jgi:phosphohistidine phosphatase